MKIKTWNIEAMTGYTPITTFYEDFSIADAFGTGAIEDTFGRAFEAWKGDYKYLTELVMALNWKIWEHHSAGNDNYAWLYNTLWDKAGKYAIENLEGDELNYYLKTID